MIISWVVGAKASAAWTKPLEHAPSQGSPYLCTPVSKDKNKNAKVSAGQLIREQWYLDIGHPGFKFVATIE